MKAPSIGKHSLAKACATCVKAKAKCVRSLRTEKCERCGRLGKPCSFPSQKPTALSESARSCHSSTIDIGEGGSSLSTPTHRIPHQLSSPGSQYDLFSKEELESAACAKGDVSSKSPTAQGLPDRSDALLDRYRAHFAVSMPFVVLPDGIEAAHLQIEKPSLLRAILAVSSFDDLQRQQALIRESLRDVSARIFVDGERSVGILQSVLVLITWSHPHVFWNQHPTSLVYLARSVCLDLGLDRSPGPCDDAKLGISGKATANGPPRRATEATQDERRAVAGAYYLTCLLASIFKRIDAPKYSDWIDESLSILERRREYESDVELVRTVRLQRLMAEVDLSPGHCAAIPPSQLRPLMPETLVLETGLSPFERCCVSQLQQVTANMLLGECSFLDLFTYDSVDKDNFELCWPAIQKCLEHCYAFFKNMLRIEALQFFALPIAAFAYFSVELTIWRKLSSLISPRRGERPSARESLRCLTKLIKDLCAKFDIVGDAQIDGIKVRNETFARWSSMLRNSIALSEAAARATTSVTMQREECSGENEEQSLATPEEDPNRAFAPIETDFFDFISNQPWLDLHTIDGAGAVC